MIVRSRYLPFKGYNAINLFVVIVANPEVKVDAVMHNHERIHTRQMLELLVVGFYLWYITEWIIRLPRKGNSYRRISFEQEAYDHENDLNYLDHRKRFAWIHYL